MERLLYYHVLRIPTSFKIPVPILIPPVQLLPSCAVLIPSRGLHVICLHFFRPGTFRSPQCDLRTHLCRKMRRLQI